MGWGQNRTFSSCDESIKVKYDSITNVIAVDEFQNDPDKLIDHSTSDDANKENNITT